ncbi:hypothetical protein EDD37DRAFT_646616 [Exophiala viscosa]|uniref:uncharacterized protein n=1 Tax=Exophiala viscosa TaxID=2486360 RepID=UPI002196856C|nr:hypothetical protein EDD37DRAFT_646616 [Exophiala viscosa]
MDALGRPQGDPRGEHLDWMLHIISHSVAEQASEREAEGPKRKNNPAQRPLPPEKATADTGTRYSLAARVQTLTLFSIGFTPKQINQMIRVPERQVSRIAQKAAERGYRPREDLRILEHYVEDGLITGRPRKAKDRETEKTGCSTSENST